MKFSLLFYLIGLDKNGLYFKINLRQRKKVEIIKQEKDNTERYERNKNAAYYLVIKYPDIFF
jgi:hypothetical protein